MKKFTDDDGRKVIAIAHRPKRSGELKMYLLRRFAPPILVLLSDMRNPLVFPSHMPYFFLYINEVRLLIGAEHLTRKESAKQTNRRTGKTDN